MLELALQCKCRSNQAIYLFLVNFFQRFAFCRSNSQTELIHIPRRMAAQIKLEQKILDNSFPRQYDTFIHQP